MKSRRMRWTDYVSRMGENWNAYKVSGRKARMKETTRNEDLDVGGF
jgi:hypothetical protein